MKIIKNPNIMSHINSLLHKKRKTIKGKKEKKRKKS